MDYLYHVASPLGEITLASDGVALTGLWFEGQKHYANHLKSGAEVGELPIFKETERWLDVYFSGKIPDFTPELALDSTPFRRAVWELLLQIPYGQTVTYGQIAQRLARDRGLSRMSAQAVGGAVGHNPISLIIPCHRVVGAGGSLTGYAGGIHRKRCLLLLEQTAAICRNGTSFWNE